MSEVSLRRELAARLAPLAILIIVVVSISAPVAYLVMGGQGVREQAHTSAIDVAEAMRDEVSERPFLWKYDSVRLLQHLRAHTVHEGIERIEILDETGHTIDATRDSDVVTDGLIWASAPIMQNGEKVGEVWVGATVGEVRSQAFLLLLTFALLGAGLAGLTYGLPLRSIARAEERIRTLISNLEQSQFALEELNASLEKQVEVRSSELAEALAEVQAKEARLRSLSSQALALQAAERRAISRDLHDSGGQALTAIRINIQLIKEAGGNPEKVEEIATRTLRLADVTLEEIRRVVDRLGPSILDEVGLSAAVERYCDDFSERSGVEVEHHVKLQEMDKAVEGAVYRMVQELLTNIARHAEATEAQCVLTSDGSTLYLSVEDDGKGFDVEAALTKGRRGLSGLRERVELLGGDLEIDSTPGRGTSVHITVGVGAPPDGTGTDNPS